MKMLIYTAIAIILCNEVLSQNVQWRGPERSGIFPEVGLLTEWPEGGPELALKVESIGKGYSSPVMEDGVIFVTGKIDDQDYLSAVNQQGEILYQVAYGDAWDNTYPDTRSTPTLYENNIYVISGSGQVICLNKQNGDVVWRVDASEEYQGQIHRWGVAESPLIVDDKVIYTNGGSNASVLAFHKDDGRLAWKSESVGGARTYVSPVLYENDGVELIIASTSDYVIGLEPETGKVNWKYRYLPPEGASSRGAGNSTNSAIIRGNEIFLSKGYDQYGVMLAISADGQSVEEKWRSEVLDTHHGHYVNVGEYIYGSNWLNNSKGNWVCLDWNTGEKQYEESWKTKGPIAYADGKLYCCEERSGTVALVNPDPTKFDVVSTFTIEEGTGPFWAHPYITDGKLLTRHGDVLMVFNLKP